MEQIKIFFDYPAACEEAVNKWLAESAEKVNITRVLQSSVIESHHSHTSREYERLHVSIFYQPKLPIACPGR
ncbi:MAG: hypothetical protein Q8R26_03360 [bacterium]|nr:hypothetical protein [bacterium]